MELGGHPGKGKVKKLGKKLVIKSWEIKSWDIHEFPSQFLAEDILSDVDVSVFVFSFCLRNYDHPKKV